MGTKWSVDDRKRKLGYVFHLDFEAISWASNSLIVNNRSGIWPSNINPPISLDEKNIEGFMPQTRSNNNYNVKNHFIRGFIKNGEIVSH